MTIDRKRVGTDCHIHLFGAVDVYPAIAERTYTPKPATLPQWLAQSVPFGVGRAVLVQPSAYGTDNSRLLDGLRDAGDEVRGIAVIDDDVADATLDAMHQLGVRGVRLNLVTGAAPDPENLPRLLRRTAARVKDLGWHMQVLARGATLDAIVTLVPSLGLPVVFDHMAGARAALGLDQPGFAAAVRLLRDGGCWIKVSGADHVAQRRDRPEDALPIMRHLAQSNPERLIWGSDWPHIGKAGGPDTVDYLSMDHGRLLSLLHDAVGDAFDRILVDNPARLYGWA